MRLLAGLAIAFTFAACTSPRVASGPSPRAATSTAPVVISPLAASPADPCRRPAAGVSTELPVADFGRILADPNSCRVFVSSPSSNTVLVLDYSGRLVKTFTDEYGADAMVTSGSVLYVALTSTGSIDEIDLQSGSSKTLASALVKPLDLALAGGRLWTTTGNCSQWEVKLVGIDLGTGAAKEYAPDQSTNLGYCVGFATGAGGDSLVAWDAGLEPANLTTLDVSSGAPLLTLTQREERLQNLGDAAITAGDKLVTASGWPYEFDQWKLSDLRQDGIVYPGAAYPVAVATAGTRIAAGVASVAGEDATIRVYQVDKPSPIASLLQSSGQNDGLYRRGLAMSPDGRLVFAVTGSIDPQQHNVTLHVLPVAAIT